MSITFQKVKAVSESTADYATKLRQLTDIYFNGLNREPRDIYMIMSEIESIAIEMKKA